MSFSRSRGWVLAIAGLMVAVLLSGCDPATQWDGEGDSAEDPDVSALYGTWFVPGVDHEIDGIRTTAVNFTSLVVERGAIAIGTGGTTAPISDDMQAFINGAVNLDTERDYARASGYGYGYYRVPTGPTGSMVSNVQLMTSTGGSQSVAGSSRSVSSVSGIELVVSNLTGDQEAASQIDDQTDEVALTNMEVGSEYLVTPVETSNPDATYPPITVQPRLDQEDLGLLAVTDRGYLFKTGYRIPFEAYYFSTDDAYLFGDGSSKEIDIFVTNQGQQDSPPTQVNISSPTLTLDKASAILGTLPAGGTEIIRVAVSLASMTDAQEFHFVTIEVEDSDVGSWNDTITLPFYRDALYFYFTQDPASIDNAGDYVSASIVDFQNRVINFTPNAQPIRLPANRNYRIAMDYSAHGEEHLYSIGVFTTLQSSDDLTPDAAAALINEEASANPDNSFARARALEVDSLFHGYMQVDDADFYSFRTGAN